MNKKLFLLGIVTLITIGNANAAVNKAINTEANSKKGSKQKKSTQGNQNKKKVFSNVAYWRKAIIHL
jgi:hypothetical protein